MLTGLIKDSNIVEIVFEESNEDGDSHKVLLRVLNNKAWGRCVLLMLRTQEEDVDFGVSVRKEYYLDEGSPEFIWVVLLWGELDEACEEIAPILNKRVGPPAPPPSVSVAAESVPSRVRKRTYNTEDGPRTINTIALPHSRGRRDIDPDTVKRVGTPGKGATVTSVRDAGGI